MMVSPVWFKVLGSGFKVQRFMVQGSRFWVQGFSLDRINRIHRIFFIFLVSGRNRKKPNPSAEKKGMVMT